MNIFIVPSFLLFSFIWWSIHITTYLYNEENIFIQCILFMFGIWLHTFIEYITHRYIFHGPMWKYHRIHHKYPSDKTHLMTPLIYSLPLAFLCFIVYYNLVGISYTLNIGKGHTLAYIMFEYIHYISHQPLYINRHFRKIKYIDNLLLAHKEHHFDYNKEFVNYGFTTLFWDKFFGTIKL
tara:strand:+ start:410 stop:949 length:540 start_codon:yes stop_codon:yes gene_type:complete